MSKKSTYSRIVESDYDSEEEFSNRGSRKQRKKQTSNEEIRNEMINYSQVNLLLNYKRRTFNLKIFFFFSFNQNR